MEPFAKDRNAEGLVRSPLRDLSNQSLLTISDSPLSGADKEKAAVDLNNSDLKTNGSATATPRSVSPTCSTPTHSNVGDTTTDEFESAEEGTPRKLSLTALAEQLDKIHLSTPQEPSDSKKPFVFPYSPAQEDLLLEEDGRETPLIFSDSVEKLGDSPFKSDSEASAVCNGAEGSGDTRSKTDLTNAAVDLQDPSETAELKVSPDSSTNELDETLLSHQSAAPTTGSPQQDRPGFQESNIVPTILDETSAAEAIHADANASIVHVAPESPKDLSVEPPQPDNVDHVTPPAEPPTKESAFNIKLCDDGVQPTGNISDHVDVGATTNTIEKPVAVVPQQVEEVCLTEIEPAEMLNSCHLDVKESEATAENAQSYPVAMTNESSDPILAPHLQNPVKDDSIVVENPVICVTEHSQLESCISNGKDNGPLNSSATEDPSPDVEQSALHGPAGINQSLPSPLNATVISAASNDPRSPVSIKTEISKLGDDEDVSQQCVSDSSDIPHIEISGASSPDQKKTADEPIQDPDLLSLKQLTLGQNEPVSASTPESKLEKKEDTFQNGCIDGSGSQVSLELSDPKDTFEQAVSPITVNSLSDTISSDGLNSSQSASEPEPPGNLTFAIDDSSLLQAVPSNSTFSIDETANCHGVVTDEPELKTTQAVSNGVDAMEENADCESDAAALLNPAPVDSFLVLEDSPIPASLPDQLAGAATLNVKIEHCDSSDASERADCTGNLDETASSPDVEGSSQSEQLATPSALNGPVVISSPGSSQSHQVAMIADLNGTVMSGPSETQNAGDNSILNETVSTSAEINSGLVVGVMDKSIAVDAVPVINGCAESEQVSVALDETIDSSDSQNVSKRADYGSNIGASPTISKVLVDSANPPNAASSVNLDETRMSTSTNSILDETVIEKPNLDVTTQSGDILEISTVDETMPASDAPAMDGNLDEANDIDMNSSHIFNERLNKLMAEGDEACAVPVPSAEVVPTSEKLAKAVKFEDCPPEVLEKYHISPKKPAPKKRFSLPPSSITNGLNSTSSGLDVTVNEGNDTYSSLDTTVVNGAKSRRSLMNTSFIITREPQDPPRSSLMDFAEAGPQMSQILATCSRQEHDLQTDTFSCIQEEAARFAEEFKCDQTRANNEAAGSSDSGREDTFQPATDFDFDFLSKFGGKGKFAANLARKSLYVKFDPLVEKVLASSEDPASELMSEFVTRKESLAEETKSDIALNNETQTEVTNETLVDDRLIPITPLAASKKTSARQISQTPSLRQEITRLQDMMLQQEEANQEKEDLVEQLRRRVRELEAGKAAPAVAPVTAELEEKDRKISALNREIKEAKNNNKQLIQVMEEYEKTISKLVAMKEEMAVEYDRQKAVIVAERDEAHQHLANMELAFNDVHQKYERAKVVIETFHANELSLKKNYDELMDTLKRQKEGYFKFKQHAAETLQAANNEIQLKEREISRMKVVVKKDELRCKSLQETLVQKDKEIEELTQICDELIAKS